MVHHDDHLALWIAVIVIAFSLLVNLGIASFVGEAVQGPSGTFPAKEPLRLTIKDLEEGVLLVRGNNHVVLPVELMGKPYAEVFATIQEHVRFVKDDFTKMFKQGARIWIADPKRFEKEIVKYTRDGFSTSTILSPELAIKIFEKDYVVWVYTPDCADCLEAMISREDAESLVRSYFFTYEDPLSDCKKVAPTVSRAYIKRVRLEAQSSGYRASVEVKCDVAYGDISELYFYFVAPDGEIMPLPKNKNYS